ncbi:MAG: hypothetical protein MSC31_12055 [Solirubrobacteraceae bacterium MAG38_C4-C5]|nr:hypothetical protein [Candidatus Siliceabacter maunaloa]
MSYELFPVPYAAFPDRTTLHPALENPDYQVPPQGDAADDKASQLCFDGAALNKQQAIHVVRQRCCQCSWPSSRSARLHGRPTTWAGEASPPWEFTGFCELQYDPRRVSGETVGRWPSDHSSARQASSAPSSNGSAVGLAVWRRCSRV